MKKRNSAYSDFWTNLKESHLTNKKKGLYDYMWLSLLKIVSIYIIIVIPLILTAKHLLDFNSIFSTITENFSDASVLIIFFISESFLGMIPPDIFMIWATKFHSPFLILTILGILSYIGGAITYQIGYGLSKVPQITAYSERRLEGYILLTRKWGGLYCDRCLVSVLSFIVGSYCRRYVKISV